ncbi:MAG: hypothetical protein HY718_18660 [Planctomycetes bacterium]|nr:hypothetical protein [Planctomycetota bacterium]
MRRRRFLLAVTVLLTTATTVGGTIAYGLYYRSDRYRRHVERGLTEFFGLPTDVRTVRPHTLRSRVLTNIQMWLPERRARIFVCPRAVWDASPRHGGGTVLHLYNSVMSIGSEAWESEDYMRVLRASLLHNFSELDIRQVRFHDGSLTWPRRDFEMRADGVDGTITFDPQGRGEAVLTAHSLNGTRVTEPVRIHALIDPANPDDFLPEVGLDVPPLPLAALGLNEALQSRVTQGSFTGRITLRQSLTADTIELAGSAQDIRLDELTTWLEGGPLSGLVDLTIHRALIRERELAFLRFNGEIRDLTVDPVLRRFGLPEIGGTVRLAVDNGRFEEGSIVGLTVAGHWRGGSLDVLSRMLLKSQSIDGQVDVRINSLIVQHDQLASGNIDVDATPPPGKPGTIDRALLLNLLEEYLGFQVPTMLARMLPESVEFVRARAKLLVDGTNLQVLTIPDATTGAILTVRIAGQDIPIVRAIDHTFDLSPLVDQAAQRAKEWKHSLQSRPAPR